MKGLVKFAFITVIAYCKCRV